MRTRLVMVLTVIGWLVFGVPARAQAAPHAVVGEPAKDLGTLSQGDKPKHTFTIKNDGSATLEISDVKPTCACTTTSFDKKIAPGKTGKINVVFDSAKFTGPIKKIITVTTNDPNTPTFELTLTATVVASVRTSPGFARFNFVQGDPVLPPEVVILASGDGKPFNITGADSELAHVKVTQREATAAERAPDSPGPQWAVEVTLGANAPVGPITGTVRVKTTHPKQPEVTIALSGVVRPAFRIDRTSLDFGEVSVSSQPAARVTIRSNTRTPAKVKSATSDVAGLAVTVAATANAGEYEITLKPGASLPKGAFSGTLTIQTDLAGVPAVTVPVRGSRAD